MRLVRGLGAQAGAGAGGLALRRAPCRAPAGPRPQRPNTLDLDFIAHPLLAGAYCLHTATEDEKDPLPTHITVLI